MCPGCWTVKRIEPDPAQLALFSPAELRVVPSYSIAELLLDHFANRLPLDFERVETPEWPRHPTNAERTRYPYH